jgi:glucosamine--fructose-6-phosphate aminotransferase (isomerizing)
METILQSDLDEQIVDFLEGGRQLIWLARGPSLAAALDGALKVQESSGLLSLAYSTAEYLHGPIASANEQDRVVILDDNDDPSPNVEALLAGLVARKTPLLVLGKWSHGSPSVPIPLPEARWARTPVLALVTQLAAFGLAVRAGVDPDAPPGLKKVTLT